MAAGKEPGAAQRFTPHRPIVMIGPMAVGKSVIGAELARVLGVEFIDSDHKIVAKHGPIPRIFDARGEHHFRQLEARAIADVLDSQQPKPVVLSLGGGAVLDSGTQQLLARATVVFLNADVETVRERILRNTGRPLLATDPVATWQRLAGVRGPVYARLANITLDVSNSNVPQLVARLIDLLEAESRKENSAQ
ncbi:shikimate kinase [Arthrobacter glacialis]|uniref:Shikimate kinase n=1 Tax=Arthrobacter glacialis TaxID=1664 RepID=A0A2S3ZX88_ARTGL|nr:shikimate kinase [Arthrobacter glacialis]POH58777.1 shikimate kinase [Arthrobacter glacialis]POH73699.1 shikimate kinase [Arthrobacter glacialis]